MFQHPGQIVKLLILFDEIHRQDAMKLFGLCLGQLLFQDITVFNFSVGKWENGDSILLFI